MNEHAFVGPAPGGETIQAAARCEGIRLRMWSGQFTCHVLRGLLHGFRLSSMIRGNGPQVK